MKEDFIIMHAFEDEGFGDTPFGASDEKEVLRGGSALDDSSFVRSKDQSNILLDESNLKDSSMADKQKIGTTYYRGINELQFRVKIILDLS